jgi:hypothetical protein
MVNGAINLLRRETTLRMVGPGATLIARVKITVHLRLKNALLE